MAHSDHHHNGHAACPSCEFGPFTRNNYFTGKLMVERDFTDEARFHIDKLRHHHQRLHGSGVVCGLKVKPHENPDCQAKYVCIEPGTAIDCCGHEILVQHEDCIDITQLEKWKELKKQEEKEREPKPHTLQICLKYRECPSELVPVLYDECGCDETKCAPNRILESYDVGLKVDQNTPEEEEIDCKEIPWRHLDRCPHCDEPDCIVIATIENYHLGDKILDMPSKPDDAANHIARIDNRKGRRLLPSTQILYEMIECIGGGGGVGPPGPKGDGIDEVQAEIIECDKTPAAPTIVVISNKRILKLQIPRGCDGKFIQLELPRIVAINWPHNGIIKQNTPAFKVLNKDGILIAFDRPMLAETLNTQTVQLLFERVEQVDTVRFGLECYCNVAGQVTGVKIEASCTKGITNVQDVTTGPVTGARFRPVFRKDGKELVVQFAPGKYRVLLEGDFILGDKQIDIPDPNDQTKTIKIHPALDANHMGPGLLAPGIQPRRCPTGDRIEGGRFVSWFTIEQAENPNPDA